MTGARALFSRTVRVLRASGVPDAQESALYLLARVLGSDSASVARSAVARDSPVAPDALASFSDLVRRRRAREPLQYLLGDWDFAGVEKLVVRPPLLCPRPETEGLVELAARRLEASTVAASSPSPSRLLLEVGCGTGAISVALLRRIASPSVRMLAVDVSEVAVEVTRENGARAGVGERLDVRLWDALGPLPLPLPAPAPLDMLVSNPPYIPEEDMLTLQPEVRQWEDPRALRGGAPFGLGFTLRLLRRAADDGWLTRGAPVLLELDARHPPLLASGLGFAGDAEGQMRLTPANEAFGGEGTAVRLPSAAGAAEGEGGAAALDALAAIKELRGAYAFEAAFMDLFGKPRFVELKAL
jgi:release factor glutamine methyltransferase